LDDSPEIARRGRFHPEAAPFAAEGFVTVGKKKTKPQSGAGFSTAISTQSRRFRDLGIISTAKSFKEPQLLLPSPTLQLRRTPSQPPSGQQTTATRSTPQVASWP